MNDKKAKLLRKAAKMIAKQPVTMYQEKIHRVNAGTQDNPIMIPRVQIVLWPGCEREIYQRLKKFDRVHRDAISSRL